MTRLIIIVPIEGQAVWVADANSDQELLRLYDWLRSEPLVLLRVAADACALQAALVGEDDEPEAAA